MTLDERRKKFWAELETFIGEYDKKMVEKFFYYWAEEMKGTGLMRWEQEDGWTTGYRLAGWSMSSFSANDQVASIRLTKAKAGKQKETKVTEEQVALARERMMENERREQETAEAKKNAVSYEEWLAMRKQ